MGRFSLPSGPCSDVTLSARPSLATCFKFVTLQPLEILIALLYFFLLSFCHYLIYHLFYLLTRLLPLEWEFQEAGIFVCYVCCSLQ